MGAKRGRACAGPSGPAPHSTEKKNSFWKIYNFQWRFHLFQKIKEFKLIWNLKYLEFKQKRWNFNFDFVQIGSSLNFNLKIKSLFLDGIFKMVLVGEGASTQSARCLICFRTDSPRASWRRIGKIIMHPRFHVLFVCQKWNFRQIISMR